MLLLKHQCFDDIKDEKRVKVYLKYQQIKQSEDTKRENPNDYNIEVYIHLFFNLKVTNFLCNLGKETKSINYLYKYILIDTEKF